MSMFFANGTVIDAILTLMMFELVVVLVYKRRTGSGPALRQYFINLLSGMCLMLAVQAALLGLSYNWIALALVAALGCHLLELRSHWRMGHG